MLVLHYDKEPGAQKEEGGLCVMVLTPGPFTGDPGPLPSPLAHCLPPLHLHSCLHLHPWPPGLSLPAYLLPAFAHSLCLMPSPFSLPCLAYSQLTFRSRSLCSPAGLDGVPAGVPASGCPTLHLSSSAASFRCRGGRPPIPTEPPASSPVSLGTLDTWALSECVNE